VSSSLRQRLVGSFTGFAFFVALLFGLSTAVFLYETEDRFFNALLGEEAAAVTAAFASQGEWGTPRHAWMAVHIDIASVPSDLRDQLRAEPERREFRGQDGRHYHVRPLSGVSASGATTRAWLVGEVSDRLVIRPMRDDLLTRWLAVQAVILTAGVAAALVLARRISRPLSTLADAVHALNPASPTTALPASGDREVQTLADALNALRARVAAFVEREHTFSRDASHELRTPLSVIRSTTETALGDPALSAEQRRLLERTARSAERMERTVRSLLELAREEPAGPDRDLVALLPVLELLIIEEADALNAAGLVPLLNVSGGAMLPLSAGALQIVLRLLLNNACAHAAAGPLHITFEAGALTVANATRPGASPDSYGLGLELGRRICAKVGLQLDVERDGERSFAVVVHA
jgi:signal transduction histidine kinase